MMLKSAAQASRELHPLLVLNQKVNFQSILKFEYVDISPSLSLSLSLSLSPPSPPPGETLGSQQLLSVAVTDPQQKSVAKQLIERHTVENVQLELSLQESETSAVKTVLSEFEEKKARLVEEARVELQSKLSQVGDTGLLYEIQQPCMVSEQLLMIQVADSFG